jgi:Ser/Thr protein kinase RdoA (MazF antagonist)
MSDETQDDRLMISLWVAQQLEPLGLALAPGFEQFTASPTSSLVRMETTGAPVWFKSTGEINRNELPISIALYRLFPDYVPRILAIHPIWNGWLSEEVQGQTLARQGDPDTWAVAAMTLAELQIASLHKIDELLKSRCKDLRWGALARQIRPFLACMSELMGAQTSERSRALNDSQLGFLGDCLKKAFGGLKRCGIPDTLGHLDPNPGNVLVCSPDVCFLDWAEACVSHPFVTFEFLCQHTRRRFVGDPTAIETLTRGYLKPWRRMFHPQALASAMALIPVVAVFVYALADNRWSSPDTSQNHTLAGYFRSLTRKAYRQATQITGGAADV